MRLVDQQVKQAEAVPVVQQSSQEKAIPAVYRVRRWIFAACIVVGSLSALGLVLTDPIYYSMKDGDAAIVNAYASSSTIMIQLHILFLVSVVYLLPVSWMVMAWQAMRRAPWLASLAMLVVLVGMTAAAAYPSVIALTNDFVSTGNLHLTIAILDRLNSDGVMRIYNIIGFHATVWAPALTGIALWRARVIPPWAAALLTFGRLSLFALDPLLDKAVVPVVFQLITWVPVVIGSIPAALAVLRAPYFESNG